MSNPRVRMVRLIEVQFVRGDGIKTRCRDVLRYIDPETNEEVFEIDPCALDDRLVHEAES
jgi:hypothetical protein